MQVDYVVYEYAGSAILMADSKPPAIVLIVDDQMDTANFLKKGLESSGLNAVAYSNPTEALDDLRQHPTGFCALLSDLRMPQMTGFELARQAKKLNPNVKVIMMTAFEVRMNEFKKALPSSKVDDIITKPASIDKVKQVLLKHIGHTKRLNR